MSDDYVPTRTLALYDRTSLLVVTRNVCQKKRVPTVTNWRRTWSLVRSKQGRRAEIATNLIENAKDESVAIHTEDYYEEQASQKQLYLDEVEENLGAILTSEPDYPPNDVNDCFHKAERYEERSDLSVPTRRL